MALTNQFRVKNDINTLGRILSAGIDIADIFSAANTSWTLSAYNTTFLVPGNSTVSVIGENGIDVRANNSTRTITTSGINATTSTRGVASFSASNFDVNNGAVIIKSGGVTNDNLAGNIADSKLNTISTAGKVANSATTATSNNTANAIVARGASGEFSSGSITATGNLSASQTVTGNIVNAATGFRINNGAPSGNVLRGDGTNFISTPLVVGDITQGAALTRSDDTNITLTLTGSPNSALLAPVGLVLGWSGQLAISRGGTGTSTGSITGAPGPLTFAAGGTNQDVTITPSGTTGRVNITRGSVTGGLTVVGNSTFSGTVSSSGVIDTGTGFRINNAATSGHVLRGNGTNFVSSTLAASDIASPQALSKVDDANVTLTLGGSPNTALLAATTLTLAWSGILGITRGGTGSNNGSITGSGALTFAAGGTNQDINLTPSGTGEVNIPKVDIDGGTIDNVTIAGTSTATLNQLTVDDIRVDGNVISSLNAKDISLQPVTGTTTATGNLSASQTITGNIINATTGFRINNAATNGHVLIGNGTNFVSTALTTIVSGAPLTKADDTNVTLTLSGSPNNALLAGVGLTLGWTGLLDISRGGTGSNNGSITGSGALTFAAGGTNQDINLNPSGTGEVNIPKVDIDGGTIDGTAIGSSTASTGRFTSLAATGNVNIDGSLFVAGSAVTINATDLITKDPLIYLAQGNAGDVVDIGFVGQYSSTGTRFTGLVRDTSTSKWNLFSGLSAHALSATDIVFTNPSIVRDTLVANIEGTLTGNVSGTANQANKLTTGRTISAGGDISYVSSAFDGTANVSGTATISNSAVTTDKIANNAVTTAKLADNAVTTSKITNNSVTLAKLAGTTSGSGIPANTILGNPTGSTANVTTITCTQAGRDLLDDLTASDQRNTLALGSTDSVTFGKVTVNNGTRSVLRDVYSATANGNNITLPTFTKASFNSAKMTVHIKQGTTKRCVMEILLTNDQSVWVGTVYGIVDPSDIFDDVTVLTNGNSQLELYFVVNGSDTLNVTASVEAISD